MADSAKSERPTSGVVTFLDVLGWKGVYDRKLDAISSLTRLIEGVRKKAESLPRGRLNQKVDIKSISDTIAIFTFCSELEISAAIEVHGELCQWLIPESIDAEIPVRGATAFGDFEIDDKSIFLGKAIDEAASWHEQSDWIGVHLTPSAEYVFQPKSALSAWVHYTPPHKSRLNWTPHCVNWTADWKNRLQKVEGIKAKFRRLGPIVPEIAPKFINTLSFIDEMAKSQGLGQKPITIVVEGQADAKIAEAIAHMLDLRKPLIVEVAGSKRALLGNMTVYARAFKDSAGIVFLADSDTNDANDIASQKAQFQAIAEKSERPDARLVLAVPEIEAWLAKTPFKRDSIRDFNQLFKELHLLQKDLAERVKEVPSLGEFIEVVREIDARPS